MLSPIVYSCTVNNACLPESLENDLLNLQKSFQFLALAQIFFFFFLWPYLQYMEIPRLGVESELQLLAYATATATRDPSRVCDLHHSSRQHQILNPLNEARDGARVLMDASWDRFRCATMGLPDASSGTPLCSPSLWRYLLALLWRRHWNSAPSSGWGESEGPAVISLGGSPSSLCSAGTACGGCREPVPRASWPCPATRPLRSAGLPLAALHPTDP